MPSTAPRPLRRTLLLGLAAACAAPLASAQAWPSRPITVVVPFPPGGGTDLVVRALQAPLQQALGQPLVIDNRGGAGGTIGSAAVARAAPDGHTVGVATTSTHAVSTSLYRNLPYDPQRDFAYAGFIGSSPYVLAVHPGLGAVDLKALVATLRKDGARLSYASVGAGTVSHLLGEQFKKAAGVAPVHIPYRGAAPAYTDLIGGQVQLMFDNPVGLAPYIRSGQVKAVAATAPNALLAGVPTFAQQGMAGLDQSLWYGFAFPKGTPREVVERFNQALNGVLAQRAVAAELAAKGVNVRPGTPQELQQAVARDALYWGGVVKSVGASLD